MATQPEQYDFEYTTTGAVLSAYIRDRSFFTGIMGPWGSGKSVASIVKLFNYAVTQEPSPRDGIRHSRWMITRATTPELKSTTIKTWQQWVPEKVFGPIKWSAPITHHLHFGDIDAEFLFLGLDNEDDVKKLLSLEYTGAFINEARETPLAIVEAVTGRAGRYPMQIDGGPTWSGVIADTNSPDEDHWWPIMAGKAPPPQEMSEEDRLSLVAPEGYSFHEQPPAMLETRDEAKQLTGYRVNPEAENLENLPADYYDRLVRGKRRVWIRCFVLNQLTTTQEGKPVYEGDFNRELHVRGTEADPLQGVPLEVGMDFGLTPAFVLGQRLPDGRLRILKEICMQRSGIRAAGRALVQYVSSYLPSHTSWSVTCDPSDPPDADAESAIAILRALKTPVPAAPAHTNDFSIRIEAVSALLTTLVEGKPAIEINPSCRLLIRGFESGYQYPRRKGSGPGEALFDERPDKRGKGARYTHPHDALQYLCLGAGEGIKITSQLDEASGWKAELGGVAVMQRKPSRFRPGSFRGNRRAG